MTIFHEYPIVGLISTILLIILAEITKLGWDWPQWVMHSSQLIAWWSAGGMFLITAHGWLQKNYKKRWWKK